MGLKLSHMVVYLGAKNSRSMISLCILGRELEQAVVLLFSFFLKNLKNLETNFKIGTPI